MQNCIHSLQVLFFFLQINPWKTLWSIKYFSVGLENVIKPESNLGLLRTVQVI